MTFVMSQLHVDEFEKGTHDEKSWVPPIRPAEVRSKGRTTTSIINYGKRKRNGLPSRRVMYRFARQCQTRSTVIHRPLSLRFGFFFIGGLLF